MKRACECRLCESARQYEAVERKEKGVFIFAILACILAVLVLFCGVVRAESIPEERAVMAIIGEAENQGADGMLAVACAIRNRGTLKGVYGEKAPRVVKHLYSVKIYKQAKDAWRLSKNADVTNGAHLWENIKAFGKPCWADKCVEIYRHKDHVFYKEVRRRVAL